MSSEGRKRKNRGIIAGGIIVFVLGLVVGVGGANIYTHLKTLKSSVEEAPIVAEDKEPEATISEEISSDDSSVSSAVLDQLDTKLVMDEVDKVDGMGASEITGTYDAYYKSCDWGAQLLRVMLKLSAPIDRARADDWYVIEEKDRYDHDYSEKSITDAFLVDANGERTTEPSTRLVLEFYTAPGEMDPFCYNADEMHYQYPEHYEVEIYKNDSVSDLTSMGVTVESVHIETEMDYYHTGVDDYELDEYETPEGITYSYAHYEARDAQGDPADTLVVYLHGLTEGGDDETNALIPAQISNTAMFLSDSFQNTMGGASILIPQCPTYWMNQSMNYDSMEWATYNPYIQSWYTGSLHQMIDYYKQKCGAKRVIITGHSNGGFMTLLMALHYENEYDGYVCMSEAMWDKSMTEEHVTNLAKLPIYFIYCNNDQTAPPLEFSIPTISRIKKHNAKRLHVSSFDTITDVTNTYYDELGQPYTFDAHQSQIYFFRNNAPCNDCGKGVWEWMATVGR